MTPIYSLRHQVLAPEHLRLLLEQRRPDGRVALIERVHRVLDEHLVHIVEEVPDALVVAVVVHHHEARLAGRHEGGHEPLVELVNGLEVHVVGFPLVLVDQIEGGVRDELVQMTVVLLLKRTDCIQLWFVGNVRFGHIYLHFLVAADKLHLENRIVLAAYDGKVVAGRHYVAIDSSARPAWRR